MAKTKEASKTAEEVYREEKAKRAAKGKGKEAPADGGLSEAEVAEYRKLKAEKEAQQARQSAGVTDAFRADGPNANTETLVLEVVVPKVGTQNTKKRGPNAGKDYRQFLNVTRHMEHGGVVCSLTVALNEYVGQENVRQSASWLDS